MAQFLGPALLQMSDSSANPLVAAKLYIYQTGTTTLLSLFSDETLLTPAANPLVADAAGVFPIAFIAETKFKAVLKTSADVILYTRDPVYSTGQADNVSAANVSFDGTGIGFSSTDVQAALVEMYNSVALLSGADFAGAVSVTGDLSFQNNDSLSNPTIYAALSPTVIDNVDGTEDGQLDIKTTIAGTSAARLSLAQGVWAARALGGDQGRDTTNLGTVFINGLPSSAVMISGLKVLASSASQVQITANGGLSVTAALSSSGANGLDTGVEAISTWYNVFIIWNGSVAAALLSTSATSPTMPSGYTQKVRVGAVRNDASSNLWRTLQYGRRAHITIGTNPTASPEMASGTTGSISVPTWTAVSVSNFVPPTASMVFIAPVGNNPTVDSRGYMLAPNNSYAAWDDGTNPPPFSWFWSQRWGSGMLPTADLTLESTNIYWANSQGNVRLLARGWEDNL
jgi:hypothetical protein